ncbi:glycosyl hydrolase family 25 [Propionicimonas paludicola]|uniref:Glycosyl hydrolase family 25 n=1 Tax=Propionicimonas paludicola TaxID=185243 RepID=A0A2A9CU86_9ACTN|nr:GH25 family lysozyme [Propionicimonas paludicola]PFG18017.1 glycosyl hydrolase family 25 [Propionicimonas paludicola]
MFSGKSVTWAVLTASALFAGTLSASPAQAMPLPLPTVSPASAVLPMATTATKILSQPASSTTNRYGVSTRTKFSVTASGTSLKYQWQSRTPKAKKWTSITGAKSSSYTAKGSKWASGTQFRVVVTGKGGKVTSAAVKLTVRFPSKTPAADAQKAFGLTGLRQGVDLSAYQWAPKKKVKLAAVKSWTGSHGFVVLRAASGAKPINQPYVNACTGKKAKTGSKPVDKDCAYATLADAVSKAKLGLGHYWFNGWIDSIDTTPGNLFSAGYTPTDSANQFFAWLVKDGKLATADTDPIVLDVEAGRAWTTTKSGKKYKLSLRAWNPTEVAEFLTVLKAKLIDSGRRPNLYVYMGANAANRIDAGEYVWEPVAPLARLWVASWGKDNGRVPDAQPLTGPWSEWSLWQYSSNLRISGSGVGALDADLAKADAWTPRVDG